MRKAFSSFAFITGDNDQFIGISLGYDFCSEHEWGIEGIRNLFEIPHMTKKCKGIVNRTITKCPKSLRFLDESKNNEHFAVLWTAYTDWKDNIREELPRGIDSYKDDLKWRFREDKNSKKTRKPKPEEEPLITAWDADTFGVGVMGEKEVGYLKELYEAFKNCNVSIARINLDGMNPFSNASLSLLITDRIPEHAVNAFLAADTKKYDLEDYEDKIGMTKLKEKKGNKNGYNGLHYFMACSPRWIDYENAENREKRKAELKTKYDIQYWINYSDNDNNFGWYTVEEIKEWFNGNKRLVEIRKG